MAVALSAAAAPRRRAGLSWQYRASVVARILAATAGAYALTSALVAVLAAVLPMARIEAVVTATLLAFLVYALAVIWVFAAGSAARAWIGLLAPTALCLFYLFPPTWLGAS